MNPQHPPITDPKKLDEEITAYLDGELSGDELREVEQRLATDEAFRVQLQAFERSWILLDQLPHTDVGQDFAATTVEMVAVTAREDDSSDNWGRQLLRQWAIGGFSVLAACVAGFLVTTGVAALLHSTGVVENPNQQLLQDLPIIEDLDKYRLVEDIDFLRDFSQLPDVAGTTNTIDVDAAVAKRQQQRDETIADRRLRVEQMADAKKKRLATNQERFTELKPEHQQQIRALYAELTADPQADGLMTAMDNYYDWYRQLTPAQHVELRVRDGAARIEYIGKLSVAQQAELADEQFVRDARTLSSWLQDVAAQHEDELLSQRPEIQRREVSRLSEPQKRIRLMVILWQRWKNSGRPQNPAFDEADYLAMKDQLSEKLRDRLEQKGGGSAAEVEFLMQMFSDQFHQRVSSLVGRIPVGIDSVGDRRLAPDGEVSRERLMEFFRGMPSEHQQRMKHLSREDFMQQLKELYERNHNRPGGGRPPFRPHRGFDGKQRRGGPDRGPPGGRPDPGGGNDRDRDFEDDRRPPPHRPWLGDDRPPRPADD